VGVAKLARLHRLASAWCRDHERRIPQCRVDVIAVLDNGTDEPSVEHLRGVG
jgi:putative endonuclease